MKIFGFELRRSAEKRAAPDTGTIPVSSEGFMAFFGMNSSLPSVTTDSALTVPAFNAAVSFLSRTLATLPLHAYRRDKNDNSEKIKGKLETIVHDAPNDGQDSFKFRQYFWQQVFTAGRGLAWIDRVSGSVDSLWLMDPAQTTIQRRSGELFYKVGNKEYPARDVIDVPYMLKPDMVSNYSPITLASKAIQLSLSMNDYASTFFAGGGVPPLSLTGPLPAGAEAIKRAQQDIRRAIDAAKNSGESVFPIPPGYELKPVGFDPAKGQMTDARRFQIEEIARVYQIPPLFLQDLTHMSYSNAEQQDLHLVKHLIGQWAEALEGEMNLKLFGRSARGRYVEHNLDGLLRGDFVTRMEGMSKGVQNGLLTPNEGRKLDNRPPLDGGDTLYIQGATVPLGSQLALPLDGSEGANDDNEDEADAA